MILPFRVLFEYFHGQRFTKLSKKGRESAPPREHRADVTERHTCDVVSAREYERHIVDLLKPVTNRDAELNERRARVDRVDYRDEIFWIGARRPIDDIAAEDEAQITRRCHRERSRTLRRPSRVARSILLLLFLLLLLRLFRSCIAPLVDRRGDSLFISSSSSTTSTTIRCSACFADLHNIPLEPYAPLQLVNSPITVRIRILERREDVLFEGAAFHVRLLSAVNDSVPQLHLDLGKFHHLCVIKHPVPILIEHVEETVCRFNCVARRRV